MRSPKEKIFGASSPAGTGFEKPGDLCSGDNMHRLVYVSGVLVIEPAGKPGKEAAGSDKTGREDEIFPDDEDAE